MNIYKKTKFMKYVDFLNKDDIMEAWKYKFF